MKLNNPNTTTMNMSYCMYENTSHDLSQVVADLEERVSTLNEEDSGRMDPLSSDERRSAVQLYELCLEYVRLMDEASETDDTFKNL